MNSNLQRLGWSAELQSEFDLVKSDGLIPARVIRENRGQYIVNTGSRDATARLSGTYSREMIEPEDYPTVGDWLAVVGTEGNEALSIRSLLPRKSRFERQSVGSESTVQTVAANFDFLFLVSGLDGDFNLHRIQRYLALAWNSRAQPIIVLNKSDLREDLPDVLAEVVRIGNGTPVHAVSAAIPSTLNCLEPYLRFGCTVALLGSSGVGKSSIINALLGVSRLATQANRESDSRGRHTTTWRELLHVPGGGMVIDLPGMRELQLTGESSGVGKSFSDIKELAQNCRFRNCSHRGEPGCAVEEAIESGALDMDRYLQFEKLQQESSRARSREVSRKRPIGKKYERQLAKERIIKNRTIEKRKEGKARRKLGGKGEW